jgi:3'-5' exoribonuclease
MVLHMADNLDAKMNTMDHALEQTDTSSWSGYQRSLERDLYAPVRTPQPEKTTRKGPKTKEDQCSLPLKV